MWPPRLEDLKVDLGLGVADDGRDDAALAQLLAAAVALVERELWGDFDFDGTFVAQLEPGDVPPPLPTADVELGAIRLAARWWARRRSPDGLVVDGGELGSARIPTVDSDIERLLGIGRWRRPMV